MTKYRRHPAQVTADRLKRDFETYHAYLSEIDRDYMCDVINTLENIADGSCTRRT